MVKKTLTMILALLMLLPLIAGQMAVPASAAQTEIPTIEEQIRAYAESIDQPGADDDAARIIAMHGIMMGGRDMQVDEDHALTALLMNSKVLQDCLIDSLPQMIRLMQSSGKKILYAHGGAEWHSYGYYHFMEAYLNDGHKDADLVKYLTDEHYSGTTNSYDDALEWIAGSTNVDYVVRWSKATVDTVNYEVSLRTRDHFDFNSSNASISADILALLGSAMFREFDWISTATFELTVPNDCPHEQFTEETVVPTCTTPGGIRHTCAACGYSYAEETAPAQGHTWGEYKSNNDATCQKDGTKTATCATCGEKKTVTDEGSRKDHDWSGATCLYPHTCLTCGETQGEYGDHDWQEATCFSPRTCKLCGATEGEPLAHQWQEATCDRPKSCVHCGLTEGDPLGHEWTGVTCEHPNTCKVCGATVGEPKEHTWVDATCTKAKHCTFCGKEEGKPIGHEWTGGSCTVGPTCKNCGAQGSAPGHNFTGGSCTEPSHCKTCGIEGPLRDHTWTAADCNSPRSCSVCGFSDGEALGHGWVDATCTEAKYCSRCDLTEGEPLGHDWLAPTCQAPKTCTRCTLTEGDPADHPWLSATCYEPKTCPTCGITEGDPLSHNWTDATCHEPKTCTLCALTEGQILDHVWSEGDCTNAPLCQLCAEARTAPGHAWLNADCQTPRTCAICAATEGEALGHPDSDGDGLCDRCGEKLGPATAIEPEEVFDWWPIGAAGLLLALGIVDIFAVRDYRRAKAGYYE